MLSFENWIKQLDKEDLNEILYEYYLMATGQDEEDEELEDNKENLAIKFHLESILFGIDKDVARLGCEVLKKRYPKMLTKEVTKVIKKRKL